MTSDQSIVLALVIFLGGIVSTTTGGGLSMIVVLVGSMFVDVRAAIVLDLYILIANQLSKYIFFHSFVRWDVAGWILVLGVPFAFIGSWYLFILSAGILKLVVGMIAIIFVSLRFLRIVPRLKCTRPRLILLGGISGFLTGAIGNGAIVRKPLLSSMGLTKEVLLGTTAVISLVMALPRMPAYAIHTPWSSSYVVFLCVAAVLLFVSAWLGKHILRFIPPRIFDILLNGVVFIGALRLLFTL